MTDAANPFDALLGQQPATDGTGFDGLVDQLAEQKKREERQRFLETQQSAQTIDPARQAKAIGVAKEQGVPVGVAYDNLDQYSAQKQVPDFDALLAKAPTTAKLVSDPVAGPVATPDHKALSDIEQNLAAFSYLRGLNTPQPSLLEQFLGPDAQNLTPEQQHAEQAAMVKSAAGTLAAAQAAPGERQAAEQGAAAGFADFEAQRGNPGTPDPMALPKPYADARAAEEQRNIASAQSDLQNVKANAPTQNNAAANFNALGAGVGSFNIPGYAGSLLDWSKTLLTPNDPTNGQGNFLTELGDRWAAKVAELFPQDKARANETSVQLSGAVGSMLPVIAAAWASGGTTLAMGGTAAEAAGVSGVTAALAGSNIQVDQAKQEMRSFNLNPQQQAIYGFGNAIIGLLDAIPAEKLLGLAEETGGRGFARILAGMIKQASVEAPTEAAQQGLQDTLAKYLFDPKRDVLGNMWRAFKVGGLAGGLFGSLHMLASSSAEDNHQKLIAIGDAAGKARISEIAPEILDEHIAQLKKAGAAPEHVTAPAEAVETLFQGMDGDTLQKFPGTVRSLQEARATGAEVTIPTEELVRLGKLKGYQNFAADVRVDDDMTLNEATKLREEIGSFVKEQDTAGSQPSQDESPIFQNIRDQLVAAGNSPEVATAQARLFDAMLTNQAERSGIPAADLARRYGVEISNSAVEGAGQTTLSQPARPNYQRMQGVDYSTPLDVIRIENGPVLDVAGVKSQISKVVGEVLTLADGNKVIVNKSGAGKLGNTNSRDWSKRGPVLARIKDVVESARVFSEADDTGKGRLHYKYAAAVVEIGGERVPVKLSFKKDPGSPNPTIYALNGYEIGTPVLQGNANAEDGKSGATGASSTAPAVNRASAPRDGTQSGDTLNLGHVFDFFNSHPHPLFQGGKDVRGSITFGPLRDKFRITLTEKANLSTFLHEGGHFFLEVLQDLVQRGEASAQQVADLKTLKRWMGIEDGKAIDVAGHEKFARTFEQFLMEGKAPSLALHAIFQKFKAWMIFVYKRLANVRGELNDEVRAVMDRLVASDAAIAEARAMVGWRGTPMSQEETGLTDAEYKAYVGEWTKANDAQSADADARIMLEAARELKKTWTEEKIKVTKEAEKALAETRGWKAWKLIEKGEGIEEFGRRSIKIDPDTIPKEWRRDTAGLTAPADQGGMDLDTVAEVLGFETGEQMLQAIGGAKLAQKAIPAKVRQIMAERHGEMDAAQLSQEAMKAVHNTPTMDVLLTEFRALAAKANLKVGKDTKRLVRATAEERVAQIPVRKLEPSKWRRAEVKAAEEAGKLAAKGRDMEAALTKRRQLMAAAMAKASLEAQDRASAIKNYLATFATNRRRAALGKAGEAYLDQVDGILEAIQLKEVSLKAIKARQGLDEFVKEQEKIGEPIFISSATRDLLGRKNYTEMSLEELEGIHDAVENLWTVAKEINTVRKGAEKIALSQALENIARETDETLPEKKQRAHLNKTFIDERMEGLSSYHAGNLKIEMVLDWLGPTAHDLIYQPVSDAAFESWKLHKELTAPFMDKINSMPKEQRIRWNTMRQFLNYPEPLKGGNLFAIALNLGNASNKEKLLAGYGWTESEVRAALDQFMTKEDWDLVQEAWDTIEKMWPKMSGVVQKATGLTPPKIEATPVETRFGTYRGGYYPVVYDTKIDSKMDDTIRSSISPEEMFSKRFTAFVMNNGFTKGRTKVTGKLLLSPDIIAQHLGEVIHYATHYGAVKQADKIIRASEFKRLVTTRLSEQVYKQMEQWLKDVATNTTKADREPMDAGDKIFRWARRSAQMVTLGINVKSALKQPLGVMAAMDAVGPKHWSIGVQKAWLSPEALTNWRFAMEKSKELRPLLDNYDRDAAAVTRAYADSFDRGATEWLRKTAFVPMSYMQSAANVATWWGAYSKATEGGMGETAAYDYADKIVRTTQGSGALKDLTGLQRGGETAKFLTMYYSYFSVLYNRIADVQVRERGVKNAHRKAARLVVLLLLPELLNTLTDDAWRAMFPPDRKKDDDNTPFLVRLALNTVDSAVNTLPGWREAAAGITSIMTGEPSRTPAAFGGLQKIFLGGKAVWDVAVNDKDMTRAKARNIAAGVSAVTNTPVYGVYRLIDDMFGEKLFEK